MELTKENVSAIIRNLNSMRRKLKLIEDDIENNIDELALVCEFCGHRIGKVFTHREFCGWMEKNSEGKMVLAGTTQEDLWAERRVEIEKKKKKIQD